jgi:alkylation response protein AidB-like acyl-CoA dehydrogenase
LVKKRMFALTADHLAVRQMAKSFADARIAQHALKGDETEHFPNDVLGEAGARRGRHPFARGARQQWHDRLHARSSLRGWRLAAPASPPSPRSMAGLDGGRLNIGACSIGGGQAALDKAIA